LNCSGKDKDKHKPVCLECENRLRYVRDIESSLPLTAGVRFTPERRPRYFP
jgi:hypothetical protein